jgi:hypothetical protein
VPTDRPSYRPGGPIYVRAVVLDRVTRLPLRHAQALHCQMLDPNGAPVIADREQATPAGVGCACQNRAQVRRGSFPTRRLL